MSESKKQIVIVCAVSAIIALSLGAGIYYTQAPPSISQATTSITIALPACYPPTNSSSVKAVAVPGAHVSPVPIPIWRYVSGQGNLVDIQVAVLSLKPGAVGHICVAYPVGKIVGGSPSNSNTVSLNPVAYNASSFTGVPASLSVFEISAVPDLVTFPQNSALYGGYLFVNYALSSNDTGVYYYYLPWAESCRDLPLSVSSSTSIQNLSSSNFDQLLNVSAPTKATFDILGSGNCPGIPPPLGGGAIVSYNNLTISYVTEETGVAGSTSGSTSSSSTSAYVVTSIQSGNSTSTLDKSTITAISTS